MTGLAAGSGDNDEEEDEDEDDEMITHENQNSSTRTHPAQPQPPNTNSTDQAGGKDPQASSSRGEDGQQAAGGSEVSGKELHVGNHNSLRVSKISGSKPAGGLTSILDSVSLKWGNLEQPADKVVAELNGKEDFTEYIQNVQNLFDAGKWEWVGCRWRNVEYHYGRCKDAPPYTEKERGDLFGNEENALRVFWKRYKADHKKLTDDAAETQIPWCLYHPKAKPPPDDTEEIEEHMGKILLGRQKREKVSGTMMFRYPWFEEIERLEHRRRSRTSTF